MLQSVVILTVNEFDVAQSCDIPVENVLGFLTQDNLEDMSIRIREIIEEEVGDIFWDIFSNADL